MNTTELYRAMKAAEARETAASATFIAGGDKSSVLLMASIDADDAADKAREDYFGAVAVLRDTWDVVPAGDAKDSAEENANDTEGCDIDHLRWLEIAVMTYSLNGEHA